MAGGRWGAEIMHGTLDGIEDNPPRRTAKVIGEWGSGVAVRIKLPDGSFVYGPVSIKELQDAGLAHPKKGTVYLGMPVEFMILDGMAKSIRNPANKGPAF